MGKITQVNNGDKGLQARTKINEAMESVEKDSTLEGDGKVGTPLKVSNLIARKSDINPIRFFCSDNDSDLTTDNRGFQYAQQNQTITSIFLAVETAPTGSGLILNVYKNGVSILTGNVTIAAGTNTLTITTPTITDTTITPGDKMEVKVITPGLTVAGTGLSAYFNTTLT